MASIGSMSAARPAIHPTDERLRRFVDHVNAAFRHSFEELALHAGQHLRLRRRGVLGHNRFGGRGGDDRAEREREDGRRESRRHGRRVGRRVAAAAAGGLGAAEHVATVKARPTATLRRDSSTAAVRGSHQATRAPPSSE